MRFLLTLFFAVLTGMAAAQLHVSNTYAASDSAVFFVHRANQLRVFLPGYRPEQLKLDFPADKLASYSKAGDTLLINIYGAGLRMPAILHVADRKTGKILGSVRLTLLSAPEPCAQAGGISDTVITKSRLLAQPGLVVAYPGSIYRYPYLILSYNFTAFAGDNNFPVHVSSPYFTEEVKNIIRSLPKRSYITFTDIKAVCPYCRTRELNPVRIFVPY